MLQAAWLLLSAALIASCKESPARRQIFDNALFTPYCNYDYDLIKDDQRLLAETDKSDFVFSGKVSSDVKHDDRNATINFHVYVKRYFKAPKVLRSRKELKVLKTLRIGEGVKCRQVVRYRYTAIFVGRKPEGQDVDVQLTINPVPVTLRNLERMNAAVKDVSYKPRQQIIEESCEKTYCAWGGQCVTGPDGRALCQCPVHCKPHAEPVCATDDKTYTNECQLRIASCKARLNTRVKHAGACELSDPCRDKQCAFGSKCVPSPDGREATCQCPENCPSYGDHSTSRPVCGSDGVDHRDLCELRRAACTGKTNITVKFNGKCDPCTGVECPEPEVCQLDDNRNPVCRCGDTCPLEFTPVCGSDGKTYSNECSLRQEACRARKSLNIIYRGKCSSGVNPCTSVQCILAEECTINKYGIARCECAASCEPIMRPVCSKDGRMYSSECELKRSACLARTPVEIAYAGVCGERGPCTDHECHFGATCIERGGVAHCECPICPAEFEPVCGSDGISYGNECKLRLEACKHRREIGVLYKGPCNGCENKKCDFYALCEGDGSADGRCVCPKSCDDKMTTGPVCGTDGVTYATECELRIASCEAKQYVLVAYKGDCDLCQGVKCKYGARCEAGECVCPANCEDSGDEPVCASNKITFSNECELQKAACLQPSGLPPLTIVFYGDCRERPALTTLHPPTVLTSAGVVTVAPNDPTGPTDVDFSIAEREACRDIHCDFDATCELGPDNFPRCTCQFECSAVPSKPVCASDLRIYPSQCAMKMEACQRQEELRLRPLDLCQGMEVKPCNGEKPLVDPVDGKELDCGNGPNRKDCPSGSYCHQAARFARCCQKDQRSLQKGCEDSWFGCCPDGKNPAQGSENAGCPSLCGCNKLGSYSETCDPESQQCRCRPGVGGAKCDRCLPGYWGLPKISSGHLGCIPCGCSTFGSVREDCEQMTGRCVCKPGIQGQKCTICTSHNKILGPNGCTSVDLTTLPPTTCKELTCHFGATCAERAGLAMCECHAECSVETDNQIVCGSDGQTYSYVCQLHQVACRLQKDIVVQAFGTCKEDMFPGTDWPIRRYTPLQFTQPDESNSPLSKSTRHLLVPDPRYYYERSGSLRPVHSHPADADNNLIAPDKIYNTPGGNFAAAFRPTPATVGVVMTSLLGDLCSLDAECVMIQYSACVKGACTCLPGYSESPDRQECMDPSFPEEYRACNSSPCRQGSTCVDLPSATFTCICGANFTGPLCETENVKKLYDIPAFEGRSYVKMKPLKAYHKLNVEIEFKTYANDGIILYNQQKSDGLGDFVSLAVVNGYVEFRYNLGNGAVIITSLDKVQLKKFHKVVIKRYHRDGMLKLDDEEDIAGQSKGSLRSLDLLESAFIGYVPTNHSRIYENIGTDQGLQGCIRKIRVGRRIVELHQNRDPAILKVEGVHECGENPCSSVPCQNGGQCRGIDSELFRCECGFRFTGDFCENIIDPCLANPCKAGALCDSLNTGKFFCRCPPGRKGDTCELVNTDVDLTTAEFNGTSFIEFPRLEGVNKMFAIEIFFLSRVANGLILYNGQMKNGRGDFISLNLVHGHIQFRFNLGSGIANITSKEEITLGDWHWVRIFRSGREGILQLDNSTVFRGYSGPPLTELNLELPFYIGSVLSWQEVHRLSGAARGFKGAIQRILINGQPLPISAKLPPCSFIPTNDSGCAFQVEVYDGHPCPVSKNPCLNNGLCIPDLNNYICQCHSNYEGKHCELAREENSSIKFTGGTFLQYKNRGFKSNLTNNLEDDDEEYDIEEMDNMYDYDEDDYYNDDINFYDLIGRKGERGNRYEFRMRTSASDGLILWRSKNKNLKEDYFSVALVSGYAEISYNLGKQQAFWAIRSKIKINDGEWHTLHVRRRKRVGFISVDGEPPSKGLSENGAMSLTTSPKLWIGGIPEPSLPRGLPSSYYKGFQGCIQRVLINAKPLNMLKHTDSNIIQFCHDNEI